VLSIDNQETIHSAYDGLDARSVNCFLPQWLGVIVEGLSPLRPLKVRALDELALIELTPLRLTPLSAHSGGFLVISRTQVT